MLSEKELKEKKLQLAVKAEQAEKQLEDTKEEHGVLSDQYHKELIEVTKIYNQMRMIQWVLGHGGFPD